MCDVHEPPKYVQLLSPTSLLAPTYLTQIALCLNHLVDTMLLLVGRQQVGSAERYVVNNYFGLSMKSDHA